MIKARARRQKQKGRSKKKTSHRCFSAEEKTIDPLKNRGLFYLKLET